MALKSRAEIETEPRWPEAEFSCEGIGIWIDLLLSNENPVSEMMFGVGVGFCGNIISSPTKKPTPTRKASCIVVNFRNAGTPERLSRARSPGQGHGVSRY